MEHRDHALPTALNDGIANLIIILYSESKLQLIGLYNLYHAFSSFLLSTAVQYLMIPREEVELDDVTSYNIFDNNICKIS